MKICIKCKEKKSEDQFHNKSGRSKLQPRCKECMRIYQREHYRKNKSKYLDDKAARIAAVRSTIDSLKTGPCVDCGNSYMPFAMDFDHRFDKEFNISNAGRITTSIERILKEIAKCDLVCATCHRIRTFNRMGALGIEPSPTS